MIDTKLRVHELCKYIIGNSQYLHVTFFTSNSNMNNKFTDYNMYPIVKQGK